MPKAKGGDASELSVVEVQGAMFGGGFEDGAVSLSPRGEETGLLVGWEVVPKSLSLEVVKDVGDAALQSFDFKLKGLLEVEEVAW